MPKKKKGKNVAGQGSKKQRQRDERQARAAGTAAGAAAGAAAGDGAGAGAAGAANTTPTADIPRPRLPGRKAISRVAPEWKTERETELPGENATWEDFEKHFQYRTEQIPGWNFLEQLQRLVWDAREVTAAGSSQRKIVIEGLRKILKLLHPDRDLEPTELQIDVLFLLIFSEKDVLMIAATGAGKTLIFQAFSMMTGMITIQIVPLTAIGEEQKSDLEMAASRLDASEKDLMQVRLITAETKKLDDGLFEDLKSGKISLLIMGPEQALLPEFQEFMRLNSDRVGLYVVDECHLAPSWGVSKFRPAFSKLWKMRKQGRDDTPQLICSATVDLEETQPKVLDILGMRTMGEGLFEGQIVRSSIDRPDTAYVILPLSKEEMKGYDRLYFIFRDAVDADGNATPDKISKAMVFQDNRGLIDNATHIMRWWLVKMTEDVELGPGKYTWTGASRSVDVCTVVTFYTSHVAEHDKLLRYNDFKLRGSKSRVLNCTPAAATGTNVPDVEIAAQYGPPIDKFVAASVLSTQQKFGRAGRLPGIQSYAILFMPYELFDVMKQVPADSDHDTMVLRVNKDGSTEGERSAYGGHAPVNPTVPEDSSQTPGELYSGDYCEDDFDVDIDLDEEEEDEEEDQEPVEPAAAADAMQLDSAPFNWAKAAKESVSSELDPYGNPKKDWTKAEMAKRDKYPMIWRRLLNSCFLPDTDRCYRKDVNEYLGEGENMYAVPPEKVVQGGPKCCNYHNPDLEAVTQWDQSPPEVEPLPTPPRKGNSEFFAAEMIKEWFTSKVDKMFPDPHKNRLFRVSWAFIVEESVLDSLGYIYPAKPDDITALEIDKDLLVDKASLFMGWWNGNQDNQNDFPMDELLAELIRIAPEVAHKRTQLAADRKAKAEEKKRQAEAEVAAKTAGPRSRAGGRPAQTPEERLEIMRNSSKKSANGATQLRMQIVINQEERARRASDSDIAEGDVGGDGGDTGVGDDGGVVRGRTSTKRTASRTQSAATTAAAAHEARRVAGPSRLGVGDGTLADFDPGEIGDDEFVDSATARAARATAAQSSRRTSSRVRTPGGSAKHRYDEEQAREREQREISRIRKGQETPSRRSRLSQA